MKIDELCELIRTELKEKEVISPSTHFKELENYGSLSAIVIIDLIEKKFGVKINPRSFRSINSVNDIVDVIGTEKFN
ncbi:acyl carrier protein [Chryseobacterium taihuense]|uniref:Acyl carrier protein n=1 Tax=Chryseobacterium taihuense TaxID=1141221 RepID=A0ABY0QTJ2_9FLAO|nr:acyl carrier protein [Chryseobacterium taihuense]SDL85680.1 Acyl carrier protein [Chryseobacterium taihuense]